MRYLLARPYPDELLGSVWIRTARRTEVPIGALTLSITGAKGRPGLFHLGCLQAMSAGLRMSPKTLLWRHTIFPYSTAFFTRERLDAAVTAALDTGPAARKVGPIVQSVSDFSRLRRFCHCCVQEELALSAESYWHREHNLPGVLVCHRHKAFLTITTLPAVTTRWSSELPHDLIGMRTRRVRVMPSVFSLMLAERSAAVLAREPFQLWGQRPDWYREAIAVLGLISDGRNIDESKLSFWLTQALGDITSLGLPRRDQTLRWAAHLVRPGCEQPVGTFKHLLLEAALRLQKPLHKPILNHQPAGFRGFATSQADAQFARKVRQVVRKYLALGERVRICDVLHEAGCWSRFRHSRQQYPAVAREVAQLKSSEAAMRPNWGKGMASAPRPSDVS